MRKQAEERRIQQEQIRTAKAAPWSQSGSSLGMSLADIQKAEREKRAQEAALQMQRLQVFLFFLLGDFLFTYTVLRTRKINSSSSNSKKNQQGYSSAGQRNLLNQGKLSL